MIASTFQRHAQNLTLAAGLLLLGAARAAIAQEHEWMIRPTKEHALLKKDVGTWDAIVKVWPMKGAEPVESKGSETNELLKGGLWLVSRFEGDVGGMPFVGVGTSGYDPAKKKYVGTWVDSMTPHLMTTEAEYDADEKTLTGTAEGYDPHAREAYSAKLIARYIDDDTRVFELHMPGEDGQHWKMMQIDYKRRAE